MLRCLTLVCACKSTTSWKPCDYQLLWTNLTCRLTIIDKYPVLSTYRLRFRWSTLIDMLRPDFRKVFCQTLAKLVIFVQFLHYCCQLWSLWAIYRWQIARLYWFLSESNLSKFRSKYLEASLMPSTRSLISDKARCFSQSERALYENFIITIFQTLKRCSKDGDQFV